MSMFNKLKQLMNLNIIYPSHKCYQLNTKSFSQLSQHVKSIMKTSNSKMNVENKFTYSKNILYRYITEKADTKVVKDVLLYHYINKRHTNIMILFGISQSFFWYYMGFVVVTELRDVPIEGETEEDKKKDFFSRHNFGENKWKYSIGLVCAIFGTLALGFSYIYNTRLITSVKLDKAGKTLTLLLSEDRLWMKKIVVPMQNISAYYSRSEMKSFFPVTIKGHRFFYIIDMGGNINNEVLFDVTIGTKRKFAPDK